MFPFSIRSRYLEGSCFPLHIRSRSFQVVISFQPFNSTGATSLLNHFNGVSFEWALTHRSFPRILPDSSYSPGVNLKFISKFDVRMIHHQSYVFSKFFQILFIVSSTSPLLIIPECLNNSWWCFSSSFSNFEYRRRVSL